MKGTLFDCDNKDQNFYNTPIQQFYSGKCIFITGATGFFGKVLLEKLLKSCTGIDTIYILLRSKKGKSVENRLKELLASPMFLKISEHCKGKIKYIDGEIGIPNLGISAENRLLLKNQVNIVFHCAATVRFDEKLKSALKINVIGTSDVVSLCKEILDLQAFIHVSTAYSNCHKDAFIREEFYSPGLSCEDAKSLGNIADDSVFDALTSKIIKTWPNTYTFTKAIGENIIKNEAVNLPVVVFRPGIALSTSGHSSIPGFIDNIYGPTGMIIGVGTGILRVYNVDGEMSSNLVPADFCINAMIAASWDVATHKYSIPPIYNYVPESQDNVSWEVVIALWTKSGLHFPVDNCFCLLKTYLKINKVMRLIDFFVSKNWTFEMNNMKILRSRMSLEDMQIFYNNTKNFDWMNYTLTQINGVRVYLLKGKPSDLIRSRKRVQRLRYVHYFIKAVFVLTLLYFGINLLGKVIL